MSTRKRWKVASTDDLTVRPFRSEAATYAFLRERAAVWFADPSAFSPRLSVWVDEGDGRWQRFEDVDLSEWEHLKEGAR